MCFCGANSPFAAVICDKTYCFGLVVLPFANKGPGYQQKPPGVAIQTVKQRGLLFLQQQAPHQ